MPRKAIRVTEDRAIERSVWVPAWGYNFLVERAERQPWRQVKAELSALLERALREEMLREGKEPGPWVPELLEAA